MVQITSSNVLLAGATLLLGLVPEVSAFWRMECRGVLGTGRIDPLANYGEVGTHAHTIFGAQDFGFNSTSESIMESSCTSCKATEDMSNYWTPSLYFEYSNGTFVEVENVGGMLAYYLLYGDDIKAFPSGFAMISGDTDRRNFSLAVPDPAKSDWTAADTTQDALAQKAIGWNCLNYEKDAEASLYRHSMPSKEYMDANCTDGMRLELMFPSCWNGKDVDSTNHKSHMAFPDLVMTGDCPSGFETRLPSLFYETIWNTYAFNGEDGQFVVANGDPTGNGYHGDFIMGWDVDTLQSAVDTCTNASGELSDCPVFTLQSDSTAQECQITLPSAIADEDTSGPMDSLPGDVQIVYGPAPAGASEAGAAAGASSAIATSQVSTQSVAGYASASTTMTDNSGGGIFVEVSSATATASTTSATSETSSTTAAATTPATTSAPAAEPEKTLWTSIYTSAGQEVHMVMMEDDVTVTIDTTTTSTVATTSTMAAEKRHIHRHMHKERF